MKHEIVEIVLSEVVLMCRHPEGYLGARVCLQWLVQA